MPEASRMSHVRWLSLLLCATASPAGGGVAWKTHQQAASSVEEIATCHILFISWSEDDRLERVLVGWKGRDILTVGDAHRFSARGGMIRFVTEQGRIRLRINLKAAEAASLKLSSKRLRPAEILSPGNE